MSQGTPVRTASKDVLARCMATEDITVQHSASAQTAYFDTQNRVLCLPVWQDMDNSMYDMLVGHEVSHALHTPAQGWQDFVGEGKGAGMRHMFLNVVEDARIERKIKDKFPGLRRDFVAAYNSLQERDIFEISGKDLSSLPLIDRLNLKFKIGIHCQHAVPFSSDEQQYVTRMAETTTFEDVVELARELYEMQVEEDDEKQEEQILESGQDSPGAGNGEGDEGTGSTPSDSDESGEGDESGAGAGDEDGDEESSGSSAGAGDESGEDSGQSMEDDTDDGESAESTTGDGDESGEGDQPSDLDYDDYKNNQDCAGGTQRAFEKGVEDLRDENSGEYQYNTVPAPLLDEIVVNYPKIADLWTNLHSNKNWDSPHYAEVRADRATALRTFQNSIKGTVAQMVQQFQMKQAADADKKTEIAKTGVLDTTTMINYRWSEDIFLKNEVHPDGKNHGMIMYVDWSGSMSGILQDTVEQLLVLVEFCRKVGIPYEVYAFSSNEYCPISDFYGDEAEAWRKERADVKKWNSDRDTDCRPHEFALYNFLSSRMNKRDYVEALNNLWLLTSTASHFSHHPRPACLALGCTPLNEAIVCAIDMVPAFQQANDIQIVNTVFLTDGDGHRMIGGGYYSYRGQKNFVTDKKTRKTYDMQSGETNALLNMLRDRTGTNLVGIRLHDSNTVRFLRYHMEDSEYAAAQTQYKKENYITLPSAYDVYFLVKGDLKVETDALENLDENASMTRIKNAFMKGGNRRKASRVIANKMVDIFAT